MNEFERIESMDAEWMGAHLGSGLYVAVDKSGGGTVGVHYYGYWSVTIYAGSNPIWESDNIHTGTPKTHAEVAEIAYDFFEDQS